MDVAQDPLNRAFAPTTPTDTTDPPLFSQITETTKDVFVYELRRFFASTNLNSARREEIPTIQKYATFSANDPTTTATQILRKFPEVLENLPHVAVLATSGSERKLTIGPPYIATVQDPAVLQATLPQPYAFVDGDILAFRVMKRGLTREFIEHIVLTPNRFPVGAPITAATASALAAEITGQGKLIEADTVTVGLNTFVRVFLKTNNTTVEPVEIEVHPDTSDNVLTVLGWGPVRGDVTDLTDIGGGSMTFTTPTVGSGLSAADIGRFVYILGPSRPHFNEGRFLITAFSSAAGTDTVTYRNPYGRTEVGSPSTFFVGPRDDYFAHVPMHRYGMSWDLGVQINILTDDENTRGEMTDLVMAFLGFFLEEKYFTFMGRSGFSGQSSTLREYYQIVFQPPVRSSAEDEIPRPADGIDKVYMNAFAVNVTTTMMIDREVVRPGGVTGWLVNPETDLIQDTTMPTPDSDEEDFA